MLVLDDLEADDLYEDDRDNRETGSDHDLADTRDDAG
jgi:hypothetical protein